MASEDEELSTGVVVRAWSEGGRGLEGCLPSWSEAVSALRFGAPDV